MYVVADFSQMKSIADYEKLVQEKISKIDVGILILNAGVGGMGPFSQIRNKDIEILVNVNALHVIYFSKVMVNQLLKRFEDTKVKSGILITSSGLGERPMAGTITYSACKSFAGFIGEGLNFELEGKVDVINY